MLPGLQVTLNLYFNFVILAKSIILKSKECVSVVISIKPDVQVIKCMIIGNFFLRLASFLFLSQKAFKKIQERCLREPFSLSIFFPALSHTINGLRSMAPYFFLIINTASEQIPAYLQPFVFPWLYLFGLFCLTYFVYLTNIVEQIFCMLQYSDPLMTPCLKREMCNQQPFTFKQEINLIITTEMFVFQRITISRLIPFKIIGKNSQTELAQNLLPSFYVKKMIHLGILELLGFELGNYAGFLIEINFSQPVYASRSSVSSIGMQLLKIAHNLFLMLHDISFQLKVDRQTNGGKFNMYSPLITLEGS